MNERESLAEERDVVDRAAEALRAEQIPPVPPALVTRTQAAVRDAAGARVEPAAASLFRHPLLRIAAVFVLAVGAAAVYAAIRIARTPDVAKTNAAPSGATPIEPVFRAPDDSRAPSPVPVEVQPDGVVRGRVRFVGVAPKPQVMSMAANAHCSAHHRGHVMDESVVVNDDGTLRNVVVWVSGGLEGKTFAPPKEPAVLDQQGCVYTPHVVTVMTGQRLLVKNSDPFLHNVRAAAASNPPFNFGQPTVDGGRPLVFAAPERLFVKCDIHPWMSAFVHVLDNPFFAVTGPDGSFNLPDLPPGKYTLSAWHEVYGEQAQAVTVETGKPLKVEFTFKATEQANADGVEAEGTCCTSELVARS